ncbi:MAG: squalene/phytoene synthase family protein [Nitrospinae bacterium]|nr:squalene/phytoene synthase family protein [Nitrospinota bacterium]MCH8207561.1 squalene/phytoene synthase family protein [Nitrospinota bacterium]
MNFSTENWKYCQETLPKVSRTFALNIACLTGDLHRSILVAYLFCRIIDTLEDAAKLDPRIKVQLLLQFARLIQDPQNRKLELPKWIEDCKDVDGSSNDLELLSLTDRVFDVFESLPENHRNQIIPSVTEMARGMAYFQKKFDASELTLLENEDELEEYCYFVAGAVGEMLCNLFFQALPGLSEEARQSMRLNAVSFGLGLQMTNISKDVIVDRSRGWSYIPRGLITASGLTVEEFSSGKSMKKNLAVLERLLHKTTGHLEDALKFTLAIPRQERSIRLFCIWPLWMAMETVAVLHNNPALLESDDPIKISRKTVRNVLFKTRIICRSNLLLKLSFKSIQKRANLYGAPAFDLKNLKNRLAKIALDEAPANPLPA